MYVPFITLALSLCPPGKFHLTEGPQAPSPEPGDLPSGLSFVTIILSELQKVI